MAGKTKGKDFDPVSLREEILANRKAFMAYNIARMRNLIKHLPRANLELFQLVPLLVHANSSELPGYVDHPSTPHGVYRFFDSGFWTFARQFYRLRGHDAHRYVVKRTQIRGLYLVGSSGTVAQTDDTGLDYWIVVDGNMVGPGERVLLSEKLERIKDWAMAAYNQRVQFFTVEEGQARQDAFPDAHRSISADGPVLKEEFYRTFMLIGGQIPYWAVLPVGLDEESSNAFVERLASAGPRGFLPDDYVDLGSLYRIRVRDCVEGILRHLTLASIDPARSLIKASVSAYHCLFQETEGLLCDRVKRAFFSHKPGRKLVDPEDLAIGAVEWLYAKLDDAAGLDRIRQAIHLRTSGYLALSGHGLGGRGLDGQEERPEGQKAGGPRDPSWSTSRTTGLDAYRSWEEDEKLVLEDQLCVAICRLCERVRQLAGDVDLGMTDIDSARFRTWAATRSGGTSPEKIPFCSAHLRNRGRLLEWRVSHGRSSGGNLWAAHDRPSGYGRYGRQPRFAAPELLRVLGWITVNNLNARGRGSITLRHVDPVLEELAGHVSAELPDLISHETPAPASLRHDPVWTRMVVMMGTTAYSVRGRLLFVDYLIQNSWGEAFFRRLDLSHIDNNLIKCDEIAKRIKHYLRQAPSGQFVYRLFHSASPERAEMAKIIENRVGEPQAHGQRRKQASDTNSENGGDFLLDLM